MTDYITKTTGDNNHKIEVIKYDANIIEDCDSDFRITKIKGNTNTLMPSNTIRIIVPDNVEVLEVNDCGVYLIPKKDNEDK